MIPIADRTVRVTLIAQAAGYVQGMEQAARKTREVGTEAEKLAQKRDAFQALGTASLAFGAATLAATGMAVKAAINWETAWTGVTKTVDGSATEMAALEGELRGLAKTLPATHAEIAAVAEAAGQLGVQREAVAGFTKVMVDLGETTNLTADEAATSIAQLMNVMGTAPEEVDNLGASLVALGNDGASTERDIVQMAQRIAGAGKIIGLTEGEVMGFANALASAGIEVEAGGSAISRIMVDIAKSVSAGGDDLQGFAQVAGMSAEDFAAAFKEAPADAIATFIEGLGGINAAGGDVFTTLSDLGQEDIRVSQALLGMANSGDLLRKSLELGNAAWEENTALQTEAEKRYASTESQLQILSNKVNDAAITFGTVFLPAVNDVAEAVGSFADFLAGVPKPVLEVAGVVTVIAGVVGVAGGAFLIAIPKVAAFKLALETLGISGGAARSALGGISTFLGGPWGIALAVGLGALLAWNEGQRRFLENAKQIADTLDEQTGEITANTREYVANRLAQEGAFEAARQVGFTQRELTDAVLQGGAAYDVINAKLDAYNNSMAGMFDVNTGNGITSIRTLRAENEESVGVWQDVTAATGEATRETDANAAVLTTLAGAAQNASVDVDKLAETIRGFGSAQFDVNTATRAFEQSVDDLTAAVAANGATLDVTTQEGRDNQAAVDDLAKSTLELAAATVTQTGDQEAANGVIANGRQRLVDMLGQFGITGQAAEDYADKLGLVPENVTTVVNMNTSTAQRDFDSFLARNDGRSITTTQYFKQVGAYSSSGLPTYAAGVVTRAQGGILPGAPSSRDNMLIGAASGEFVVRASQVGPNLAQLNAINSGSGRINGYAGGGQVAPVQYAPSGPAYAPTPATSPAATGLGRMTGNVILGDEIIGRFQGMFSQQGAVSAHQQKSMELSL